MVTITIDTKKDSREEIEKSINLIKDLMGSENTSEPEAINQGAFNLFGSDDNTDQTQPSAKDQPKDGSEEEVTKIQLY